MEMLEQLTGEMLLFGLLGKLLYQPPDADWLGGLFAENVFADLPLESEQSDVSKGLDLIQSWVSSQWAADPKAAVEALDGDYMSLFIGPGEVKAPPWESVYFSDNRLLFQVETLHVRAWYERYGVQVENYQREPDDHIGLELGFLAHLAQLGVQALVNGDVETANQLVTDQVAFLAQHLLPWVSLWCGLVDQSAKTDFYRGVAFLTRGMTNEVEAMFRLAAVAH